MKDRGIRQDDNLFRAVLGIITDYQPIPTLDIWYELGEDESVEDRVALAEVLEILSHLENGKQIFKGEGDRWGCSREETKMNRRG